MTPFEQSTHKLFKSSRLVHKPIFGEQLTYPVDYLLAVDNLSQGKLFLHPPNVKDASM